MSDAWHHYEQGWSSGWLLGAVLAGACVVALVRLRRRIPRLEMLFYAASAVGLGIWCWEFTLVGVVLLFAGFPDALLGLVAVAPAVLVTTVLTAVGRTVRTSRV